MRTKAGMPTTTIVIIAIVIMLIATALIFLALPYLEDEYGEPGKCDDTSYWADEHLGSYPKFILYKDSDHPNRYIIYWLEGGGSWQYHDGFEGFESAEYDTLHDLRTEIQAEYEGNNISEGSWHWFDCTAGAIS